MKKLTAAAALTVLFLAGNAAAEEESYAKKIGSLFENWSLTLGGGIVYQPKYQGSRDMRLIYLPAVAPVYRKFLYITPMGGGVYFPIYKGKIIGSVALGKDLFKLTGERVLRGISDQESGLILDAKVMFNFSKNYNATITARKVFWGSDGLLIEAKAAARYEIIDGLTLSFGAKTAFGDSKYMRFKFGITSEQAMVSGFREYEPGPALKSVSAEISIKYKIIKSLTITVSHSEGLLINQALSSPTTFRQRQPRTTALLTYTFN